MIMINRESSRPSGCLSSWGVHVGYICYRSETQDGGNLYTKKCETQDVLHNKHVVDKERVSASVSVLYGSSSVQNKSMATS